MKLLLTSGGVSNPTIHQALVDLLPKPITECSALCIPTVMYGHPWAGPGVKAWRFVSGTSENPMVELGWKSVGILELTALPSIQEEQWAPLVREADVLLVSGGDAVYLCHWLEETGLAAMLPSLEDTVWVGLSAGSMVMTPRIGMDFVEWKSPAGDDETLGFVDFSICPHIAEDGQGNSMAFAERWLPSSDFPPTRWTTRPRSEWTATPSRLSPRAIGGSSPQARTHAERRRGRALSAGPCSGRTPVPA